MTEEREKRPARPERGSEEDLKRRQERQERREKNAENPYSIGLAPRTMEGHMIARALYPLDNAINRIRRQMGTYIKIGDARTMLTEVEGVVVQIERLVEAMGAGSTFFDVLSYRQTLEEKRELAKRDNSYMFVARTDEGTKIAKLLRVLDPAILKFKETVSDFEKSDQGFKEIASVILAFCKVTETLTSKAGVKYAPPKRLGVMRESAGEAESAEREVGDAAVEEKQTKKKA